MRISFDDQYLITVSEDCCLFVYKITDKEGRGKRERDIPYAEEVLITKSDLEEKVCIVLFVNDHAINNAIICFGEIFKKKMN